jgi:hypothetical protein
VDENETRKRVDEAMLTGNSKTKPHLNREDTRRSKEARTLQPTAAKQKKKC